jgi:hypothetical protein
MINGHALVHRCSSFVAAIPLGPDPRSRWSARSNTRTHDLEVGGQWNCLRRRLSRNVAERSAAAEPEPPLCAGLAIKSRQTGNRTDPGDLALGKSGRHSVAGRREVTCRRKTSAARLASWSLVET